MSSATRALPFVRNARAAPVADSTGRSMVTSSSKSVGGPRRSIETMRAIAVLLLVSYHVIGADARSGLKLDYPHPFRIYADLFIDSRMPMFAMISGMVYALRPVQADRLGSFLLGKLRRLAVPGAVAITVFAVLATLMHTEFAVHDAPWTIYAFGYAHFWFLQAILVIFLTYVTLDIVTKGRFLMLSLVLAFAASFSLHPALPAFFSINTVPQLLPYFILGVVLIRHADAVMARKTWLVSLACIAIIAGLMLNAQHYSSTGSMSADRFDLQSLLLAGGMCVAGALVLPHLPILNRFGAPGFMIYLYHILGTSASRRVLLGAGIDNIWVHLLLGTAAGVVTGFAIYRIAGKHPLSRLIVLGERTRKPAA